MAIRNFSAKKDAGEIKGKDSKYLSVKIGTGVSKAIIYVTDSVEETHSFEARGCKSGMRLIKKIKSDGYINLYNDLLQCPEIKPYVESGILHLFWDNHFNSPVLVQANNKGGRKFLGNIDKTDMFALTVIFKIIDKIFAESEYGTVGNYMKLARKAIANATGQTIPNVDMECAFKEEVAKDNKSKTIEKPKKEVKEELVVADTRELLALKLENNELKLKIKELEEKVKELESRQTKEENQVLVEEEPKEEIIKEEKEELSLFTGFTPKERQRYQIEEDEEDEEDSYYNSYDE